MLAHFYREIPKRLLGVRIVYILRIFEAFSRDSDIILSRYYEISFFLMIR